MKKLEKKWEKTEPVKLVSEFVDIAEKKMKCPDNSPRLHLHLSPTSPLNIGSTNVRWWHLQF